MTYHDPKYHLSALQVCLQSIEDVLRLLKIASKENEFNDESFQNIHLLIALSESHLDCYVEELGYHLQEINRYLQTYVNLIRAK